MPQDDQQPFPQPPSGDAVPETLASLRAHLKDNPERLLTSIDALRKRPFLAGETSLIDSWRASTDAAGKIEPEHDSIAEAAKKIHLEEHLARLWPRSGAHAILFLKALSLCLFFLFVWLVFLIALPEKAPHKRDADDSRQTSAQRAERPWEELIEAVRESAPAKVASLGPRVVLVAISLGGLSACIWLLYFLELPAHEPDPLFDRMLQQRSPSPVSSFVVTDILGDPRFGPVLYRAQETVFPLVYSSQADFEGARYDGEYHYIEATDSYGIREGVFLRPCIRFVLRTDLSRFIDRLVDHLDPDGQCARFFINHPIGALNQASSTFYEHLEHEMREMLFAEIFDDPAFVYIYKRNQPKWRQVMAWFLAFDFERAMKLFRPGSSPKEKPDKMQLAVLGVLVVLVVVILNQPRCPERTLRDGPSDPRSATLTLAHSSQLEELVKSFRELAAKLVLPEPLHQDPIQVEVVPAAAPIVNVPVTLPDPAKQSPSNVNTNFNYYSSPKAGDGGATGSTAEPGQAASGSSVTNNVIASPPPVQQVTGKSTHSTSTTGGDDFATFTYTKSDLAGKQPQYLSNETLLTLHTAKGEACTYKARVAAESLSPPDPVSIAIVSTDARNPDGCEPKIAELTAPAPGNANLITATRTPSYSELLHAYISVEAFHRKHLPPFAKKDLVLKIHYETEPRS